MTVYMLSEEDVAYIPATDMLYAVCGDGGSLDVCDEIEDVAPGITVMITDGLLSGVEIYDFEKTYGGAPVTIDVPARNPFTLSIPALA